LIRAAPAAPEMSHGPQYPAESGGKPQIHQIPDASAIGSEWRHAEVIHMAGQRAGKTPRLLYDLTELVEADEDDFRGGTYAHWGAPGSGTAGGVDG